MTSCVSLEYMHWGSRPSCLPSLEPILPPSR